jgi:hypothetical protein
LSVCAPVGVSVCVFVIREEQKTHTRKKWDSLPSQLLYELKQVRFF